jgi:hypothetical protein
VQTLSPGRCCSAAHKGSLFRFCPTEHVKAGAP